MVRVHLSAPAPNPEVVLQLPCAQAGIVTGVNRFRCPDSDGGRGDGRVGVRGQERGSGGGRVGVHEGHDVCLGGSSVLDGPWLVCPSVVHPVRTRTVAQRVRLKIRV